MIIMYRKFIHEILLLWYIYTDGDDKKVERDMYAAIPYFQGSHNRYGYEKWENHFEELFSYLPLTSEQKCRYAQMKLDEEDY